MSKTYGASIRCAICGAEPLPSSDVRETFSLTRYGPNGLPSDSPAPANGVAKNTRSQARRSVRATPTEALADFQDILEAEIARLGNEASDRGGVKGALGDFRQEVERGLTELRKALAPQKPPAPLNGAFGSRRPPKKRKAIERHGDGQQDWVAGDAEPMRPAK